jgi:hypothetical protein
VATHPLSFCEVLEDEYRYMFGELEYGPFKFERKHIREIADLVHRLDMVHQSEKTSRWHLLAAARSDAKDRQTAVIDGLNSMLGNPRLLHELLTHDEDREEQLQETIVDQIRDPNVWRALLAIAVARRLLLEEPRLLEFIVADPDFIDIFAARSAAVRLLISEEATPIFRAYPALLSTIADNEDLERLLTDDQAADDKMGARTRRDLLRKFFAVERRPVRDWLREHLSPGLVRYLPGWIVGPRHPWKGRPGDLTAMSQNNSYVQQIVGGGDDDALPPVQQIPPQNLARFNAILIETAYCAYISDGQKMHALYAAIHEHAPAALCLSGGGIRSATFNLGVLQGLADHRMLNRLHYLSTVSGGGYIGSWLSSWMRRHHEGAVGVAKDLSRQPTDPLKPEVKPIEHLREYSAYLAPRATAFSLDSWTIAATYVRNLLLNWTMLIPALAAALALPRVFQGFVCAAVHHPAAPPRLGAAFASLPKAWKALTTGWAPAGDLAILLALTAAIMVGFIRPATPFSGRGSRKAGKKLLASWLIPLILSGFLFCTYWATQGNYFSRYPWLLVAVFAIGSFIGALGFGFHLSLELQPLSIADEQQPQSKTRWERFKATIKAKWRRCKAFVAWVVNLDKFGKRGWSEIFFAVISGAIGGWLLNFSFRWLFPPSTLENGIRMELYICFGVPLYLAVFFIEATLLLGFTTIWCRDYDREWWARGAAALFVYNTMHALGAFAVLLVPLLIFDLPQIVAPLGGLSGIGAWLLSRVAKGPAPEKESARTRWLMPLLRLSASVALIFFVALISMLTARTLGWMNQHFFASLTTANAPVPWLVFGHYPSDASVAYMHVVRGTSPAALAVFFFSAMAVALFMSVVLNVNVYSMHGMYRNRLIRAYLGASRWERHPDSFTGFDPQDNMEMWKLRPQLIRPSSFLDFDRFANELTKEPYWNDPKIDFFALDIARTLLAAYINAPTTKKPLLDGETRTAVSDAINELMRTRDLRHRGIPAPSTLDLLESNRCYLEGRFPTLRKRETLELDRRETLTIPSVKSRITSDGTKMPGELIRRCFTDRGSIRATPPLHVLSTALNLVHGQNLAWQERKAASFTISPLHAGSGILGYRDSADYAKGKKSGISLGTAMAISGAAVSPNRGSESSPTFTFLMTLFNARLGWWLGNPKKKTYTKEGPKMSIFSLLREALGRTDENHPYVYLSDGGHFENLGLYEMVRRRCKYIIVSDATADSNFGFGDLANAVRKVRIDLGIPIEPLVTKYIGPQKDERFGKYCAFGHIRYQDVDGGGKEQMGYLLYIKPCVFSECPADVRNYAKEHRTFPHETTVDQFFSESQFESYRALGRHIIGRMCGDDLEREACVAPNVPTFFANAWTYVHTGVPPAGDAAIENVSDVVSWMRRSLGEHPN